MKKIKIIIERSEDSFGAYAENVEKIVGMGDTVEACKLDILACIETILTFDSKNIPSALKGNYELIFKMDIQSLLNYYKGVFTNAAIERLTGINQKQLQHYATGLRKPRATQTKRIEKALHGLGAELLALEL